MISLVWIAFSTIRNADNSYPDHSPPRDTAHVTQWSLRQPYYKIMTSVGSSRCYRSITAIVPPMAAAWTVSRCARFAVPITRDSLGPRRVVVVLSGFLLCGDAQRAWNILPGAPLSEANVLRLFNPRRARYSPVPGRGLRRGRPPPPYVRSERGSTPIPDR